MDVETAEWVIKWDARGSQPVAIRGSQCIFFRDWLDLYTLGRKVLEAVQCKGCDGDGRRRYINAYSGRWRIDPQAACGWCGGMGWRAPQSDATSPESTAS